MVDVVIGCPLDEATPMAAEPRRTHCEKYYGCWCLFITLVAVGAIVTTIVLLADYSSRVPSFTLSSATVSSSNLSSSSPYNLFSEFDLTLSAQNAYKGDKTNYEFVSATVFYGQNTISQTSNDGERNETAMHVKVGTVDGNEAKGGVTESMTAVTFNVRIVASVRCWNGPSKSNPLMMVDCKNVLIGFTNSTSAVGSLVGPPRRCGSYETETSPVVV